MREYIVRGVLTAALLVVLSPSEAQAEYRCCSNFVANCNECWFVPNSILSECGAVQGWGACGCTWTDYWEVFGIDCSPYGRCAPCTIADEDDDAILSVDGTTREKQGCFSPWRPDRASSPRVAKLAKPGRVLRSSEATVIVAGL